MMMMMIMIIVMTKKKSAEGNETVFVRACVHENGREKKMAVLKM